MKQGMLRGVCIVLALVCGLAAMGCSDKEGDANSSSSGGDSGGSTVAGMTGKGDKDAVKAVSEELDKRWLKVPDGWISEFPSKVFIGTGEAAGPEVFYREIKELTFDIEASELSESDKLNGITYRGYCSFNNTPVRLFNDPNSFDGPKWSSWHANEETFRIEKKNGKWSMGDTGYIISGKKPNPSVLATLK